VLDIVAKAQGKGCAPGFLGVCVGGNRLTGHLVAKEMIFRLQDDRNPNQELAALEERLARELDALGVGPMGFGGRTTVLGVKIGTAHRLPASFYVTVAYECWACRRATVTVDIGGAAIFGQVAYAAEPFLAEHGGAA
jgi:fumarate hydratase class I